MHSVFWFKLLAAHFGVVAVLYLIFARASWMEKAAGPVILIYYGVRIAVLVLIHLVLHFAYPSENMSMYHFNANIVLHGAMPNRDFYTLYGVLFPYLLAGAEGIWHDRFALTLLLQLVEGGAVYSIFTQRNVPLTVRSFLIYALNPLTLVWIWLGLQNQVMCLLPVVAVMAVPNQARSSIVLAFGFAISKIFSLWTALPSLLSMGLRSMVVFGITLLVIYTPFWLAGSTGISFRATEYDGHVTDDTGHCGVQSWIPLVVSAGPEEASLSKLMLRITAGLLLLGMLTACWLQLRLNRQALVPDARFRQGVTFTAAFSTLLTLTYQAFSSYTVPEYLLVAILLVPILAALKFWTAWDQVFCLAAFYLQTMVFLLWFHLPENGTRNPHDVAIFTGFLIADNLVIIALCLWCAYRIFTFFVRDSRAPALSGASA